MVVRHTGTGAVLGTTVASDVSVHGVGVARHGVVSARIGPAGRHTQVHFGLREYALAVGVLPITTAPTITVGRQDILAIPVLN
jgi:hypothetical protein